MARHILDEDHCNTNIEKGNPRRLPAILLELGESLPSFGGKSFVRETKGRDSNQEGHPSYTGRKVFSRQKKVY